MKQKRKNAFLFLALVFIVGLPGLQAEETGFEVSMGNYGLEEQNPAKKDFQQAIYWGGSLYYRAATEGEEDFNWGFSFTKDPLMGFTLNGELSVKKYWYSISLGPALGILNESWTLIKPGLSSKIQVEWPGILFAGIGGTIIPGGLGDLKDNYSSSSSFLTIGFYLLPEHIRCYFTQVGKTYSSREKGETRNYKSYIFYTDFYKKNSVFKLKTKLGYEILKKDAGTKGCIEMKNILIGIRTDFFIKNSFTLYLGLDSRIYPQSSGKTNIEELPPFMGEASLGFSWMF